MPRPEGDPARHVPPVWCAPHARPGHDIGVARCLSLLDSVTERSFLAGLALENLRVSSGPEAAAGICRALGQLDELIREVRDFALELHGADTRVRSSGPAGAGESGTE